MKSWIEMTDFERWWFSEGSEIPPLLKEDAEEHFKRVCRIAWENGEYKAKKKKKAKK